MPDATAEEIARLEQLLAAREGAQGYADNVKAIKARIAELKDSAASE